MMYPFKGYLRNIFFQIIRLKQVPNILKALKSATDPLSSSISHTPILFDSVSCNTF